MVEGSQSTRSSYTAPSTSTRPATGYTGRSGQVSSTPKVEKAVERIVQPGVIATDRPGEAMAKSGGFAPSTPTPQKTEPKSPQQYSVDQLMGRTSLGIDLTKVPQEGVSIRDATPQRGSPAYAKQLQDVQQAGRPAQIKAILGSSDIFAKGIETSARGIAQAVGIKGAGYQKSKEQFALMTGERIKQPPSALEFGLQSPLTAAIPYGVGFKALKYGSEALKVSKVTTPLVTAASLGLIGKDVLSSRDVYSAAGKIGTYAAQTPGFVVGAGIKPPSIQGIKELSKSETAAGYLTPRPREYKTLSPSEISSALEKGKVTLAESITQIGSRGYKPKVISTEPTIPIQTYGTSDFTRQIQSRSPLQTPMSEFTKMMKPISETPLMQLEKKTEYKPRVLQTIERPKVIKGLEMGIMTKSEFEANRPKLQTKPITELRTSVMPKTKNITDSLVKSETRISTLPKTKSLTVVLPHTTTKAIVDTLTRTKLLTQPLTSTLTKTKTQPLTKTMTKTLAQTATLPQTLTQTQTKMQTQTATALKTLTKTKMMELPKKLAIDLGIKQMGKGKSRLPRAFRGYLKTYTLGGAENIFKGLTINKALYTPKRRK